MTETLSDKIYRINMGRNWIEELDVKDSIMKLKERKVKLLGRNPFTDKEILLDAVLIEDIDEIFGKELAKK